MIALLSAKIVTVTMKLTTSGAPFEFLSNWNNWNETKRNCLIEYVERSLELKKVLATTWVKIIVYVVRESIHICRMWRNFAPTCFINLVKHTCKWDNFYAILVFFVDFSQPLKWSTSSCTIPSQRHRLLDQFWCYSTGKRY